MKRLTYYISGAILIFCLVHLYSCQKRELEDFSLAKATGLTVSAGTIIGEVEKNNENVAFEVGISLSAPADKAFQVGLELNNDTINALIESGTLENTVPVPLGSFTIPNVAVVPFGVDYAKFKIQVSISAFERNYGKKLALAINLIDPTKGNKTDGDSQTAILMLDSRELLEESEIHYLSVTNQENGILNVERGVNYRVSSAGLTIPLGISLAGVPGRSYTVKAEYNIDTIASLIASGILPVNVKALQENEFNLDTLINVGSNISDAPFEFSIPWNTMDNNLENPVAVVISLRDPSRHVLHPVEKTVVVIVDPSVSLDNNSYLPGSGSGLLAEYFKGTQLLDEDGRQPDLVRIDERIDFVGWEPFPGAGDNWSVRWTGEFFAPVRGEYIFYQTQWDDGARLIVDGKVLVDDFTTEWDKPTRFGRIFLERGQRYTIEAHHRENVGGQQAKLEFEVASEGIARQIIPRSLLYPAGQTEE